MPAPAVADHVGVQARDAGGVARRAVDGGQRATAPADARKVEGRDVAGKTGHGAGDLQRGPRAARGHRQGPARPRLVRVLCAAGQPGDCRRHLRASTASTGSWARRSPSTSSTRISPRRKAGRCRVLQPKNAPTGGARATDPDSPPVAAGDDVADDQFSAAATVAHTVAIDDRRPKVAVPDRPIADVRKTPLLPRRLGHARRRSGAVPDRGRADLQRHRRRRPACTSRRCTASRSVWWRW